MTVSSFWGNIFQDRTGGPEQTITQILNGVPIFEGLNKRELAAVQRILHRREYNADESIFHQGEPGLGMYIIAEGHVAIVREPAMRVLAELHAGEFFGEVALLDELPRSASAVARSRCSILGFFRPDLLGLIERQPRLGIKILVPLARIVGARLRKSNEELLALQSEGPTLTTHTATR